MFDKVKKLFFFSTIVSFVIFITVFYFSEENKNRTIKVRSIYPYELISNLDQLPILLNDTKNIIEYKNNLEEFKNTKNKRKFWDLIGN